METNYGTLVIKDINHGYVKDIHFLPLANYPFTEFIHNYCKNWGYNLKDIVEEDNTRTVRAYVSIN